MTGLLIGLAVIAAWLALSALLVALVAGAERLWRRVAACRLFGHRWAYVKFYLTDYSYCRRCGRVR